MLAKHSSQREGLQMHLTYFEAVGLLAITPIAMYVCYWTGWDKGKKEGYRAGRSVGQAMVRNDR